MKFEESVRQVHIVHIAVGVRKLAAVIFALLHVLYIQQPNQAMCGFSDGMLVHACSYSLTIQLALFVGIEEGCSCPTHTVEVYRPGDKHNTHTASIKPCI